MNLKTSLVASGNKQALGSNWSTFDWCNQFLQTAPQLAEAAQCIAQEMRDEHNVRYLELRFCPTLHNLSGLLPLDAVTAVMSGLSTVPNIETGVILCALRSRPLSEALSIVRLAHSQGCGFDIAGDEGSFPIEPFLPALRLANELGVKVTVHAAEWPAGFDYPEGVCSSVDNLDCLLHSDVKVDRLGHGTFMSNEQLKEVMEREITVESCVTSNLAWKVRSYEEHPVKRFLDSGLRVCLNCDNLLLSGNEKTGAPTPNAEISRYIKNIGGSESRRDVMKLSLHGIDGAWFASEDFKQHFRREVVDWARGCLSDELTVLEATWGEDVRVELPRIVRLIEGSKFKVEFTVPLLTYPAKGCVGVRVIGGEDGGLGKRLRELAEEGEGEGALFDLFKLCDDDEGSVAVDIGCDCPQPPPHPPTPPRTLEIAVRVIKSHHIIASKKIKDIKSLYKRLNLTGVMKIGWPGVIVVEGGPSEVESFVKEISGWNWQHIDTGAWSGSRDSRRYGKLKVSMATNSHTNSSHPQPFLRSSRSPHQLHPPLSASRQTRRTGCRR